MLEKWSETQCYFRVDVTLILARNISFYDIPIRKKNQWFCVVIATDRDFIALVTSLF